MIESNDTVKVTTDEQWLTLIRVGDTPVAIVDSNDPNVEKWIKELEANGIKPLYTSFRVGSLPKITVNVQY